MFEGKRKRINSIMNRYGCIFYNLEIGDITFYPLLGFAWFKGLNRCSGARLGVREARLDANKNKW